MKYVCSQSSNRSHSASTSLALIPVSALCLFSQPSCNSARPSGLPSPIWLDFRPDLPPVFFFTSPLLKVLSMWCVSHQVIFFSVNVHTMLLLDLASALFWSRSFFLYWLSQRCQKGLCIFHYQVKDVFTPVVSSPREIQFNLLVRSPGMFGFPVPDQTSQHTELSQKQHWIKSQADWA